jgi:hypothetical protein
MNKCLCAAVVILISTVTSHAAKLENTLFTCDGTLTLINGVYSIDEPKRDNDTDYYPMVCFFDKGRISKQILAVCRTGDRCIVSAKGVSGNRNEHIIEKVFEVQRGQKIEIDPLPDEAQPK